MAELATSKIQRPAPVGDGGAYNAIDELLAAAGVPPDGGAEDLDKVVGEEQTTTPVTEEEEETPPETEEETTPEAEEEEPGEEEGDEDAGAETELDSAALASALGLGDADPSSMEFNDDGELLIPWKVEDETGTATVNDLVRGYQLNRNLTRKAEDLTQAKQVVEHERTQLHAQLNQQLSEAATMAKTLQDRVTARYESVDWAKLEADEGAGAVALRRQELAAEFQGYQRDLDTVKETAQRAAQERHNQQTAERKQYLAREAQALLGVIPDFGKDDKAPALQKRMRSYLADKGLNESEVSDIIDHRQLSVIYDAMRWRESQKEVTKAIKKVVKVPRIRKGGSPRGKSEITDDKRKTAMSRVRKSGSEFDAGRAMLDMGLVDDV